MAKYTKRGSSLTINHDRNDRKRWHHVKHRQRTRYDCFTLSPPRHPIDPNSLISFSGQIDDHYPKDKFLATILLLRWLPPRLLSGSPIPWVTTAFTDGVRGHREPYTQYIEDIITLSPIFFSSQINPPPQFKELRAIILVLTNLKEPFNLYSASIYAVNLPT